MKVANYWTFRQEEWDNGICAGSVAAIAMASVYDQVGEFAFSAHISRIVEENEGNPEMTPLLKRLLTHPAVTFINVEQHGDIDDLIRSFYREQIDGISFIEVEEFFAQHWGPNWNGRDASGNLKSTTGVLNIIEHAFKGYTYFKNPSITMSDWLSTRWSNAQKRYTLEDVFFLAKAIGQALGEEGDERDFD